MGSGSPSETGLEFTPDQEQVIGGLAAKVRLVSVVLFALAVLRLVSAALDLWAGSWGAGILGILLGVVLGLLGLILLTGADDARFIVTTKGHTKVHLLNTLTSVNVWLKFLLLLVGLVALADLAGIINMVS
jgi:hypothetical protein